MYPDFSYILHALFGTEPDNAFSIIKTFGLFLGFAFLASGSMLYFELKRKEKLGQVKGRIENVVTYNPINWKEIFIQAFINFIIASKIGLSYSDFGKFKMDPAAEIFSLKGNYLWGIVGFSLTVLYWWYKMSKQTLKEEIRKDIFIHPHERVIEITGMAAIWGIIGSKLFSVLENFSSFVKDPIGEFFSGSGLTVYGGLILSTIIIPGYLAKKGLRVIHMLDAIAPTLMIGYCVGRMGCHFSGDGDWGIINELPKPDWFVFPQSWWANGYPHNVLNEGIAIEGCKWAHCMQLVPNVFPTPLYEVILAGIITLILWLLRTKIHRAGILFFLYCFLNGCERFFIEFLRVNPHYDILGYNLSQAQFIAIGLIVIGISGMIIYYKKNIRD